MRNRPAASLKRNWPKKPAGTLRRDSGLSRLLVHELLDLLEKLPGILVSRLFQDDVLLDCFRKVALLEITLTIVLPCLGKVRFQLY